MLLREWRGEVDADSAPWGVDAPEVGVWGLEVEEGWLPIVTRNGQAGRLRWDKLQVGYRCVRAGRVLLLLGAVECRDSTGRAGCGVAAGLMSRMEAMVVVSCQLRLAEERQNWVRGVESCRDAAVVVVLVERELGS